MPENRQPDCDDKRPVTSTGLFWYHHPRGQEGVTWRFVTTNYGRRPFLERRRPVEDDGQRRRAAGLPGRRVDEESLSILGHGVGLVRRECRCVCGKEGLRQSGIE